ncbi:hypothetical protein E2320_014582, partial [Naja naja]
MLSLKTHFFLFLFLSQFPCATMQIKCPLKVTTEEFKKFNYYKPGDYLITAITSKIFSRRYPYVFSKPPNHRLKRLDLQHKHALFSFITQTNKRQYYNLNSYSPAEEEFVMKAFQCSYSKPVLSKKVWERCIEKESQVLPPQDVLAKMLTEDGSSISRAIQAVASVLNVVSSSHPMPSSRCSESCYPGYAKVMRKEAPICCYDCSLCMDGTFSMR